MGSERSSPEHWDRVAAELKAYRDYQRETWGDLDNEVIGRYLAGEAGADERAQVEAALADHPDLLMLTELVRDVLAEPRSVVAPVPEPVILPFTDAVRAGRRVAPRTRRWFAVVAAACVFFLMGSLFSSPTLFQRGADGTHPFSLRGLSADRGESSPLASPIEEPVQVVALSPDGRLRGQVSALKMWPVSEPTPAPAQEPALMASAEGWHRAGVQLQRQGQLSAAEVQLRRAYGVRKRAWGQEDSRTLETLDTLTSLYEDVLAVNTSAVEKEEGIVFAHDSPTERRAPESRKIAESQHFFAQHGQVLPPTAVPVLVDGIEQNRSDELRERCARTLARMGPAAQEATRTLTAKLAHCECPAESQALALVLAEIGGGERGVVQALESLEKAGPTEQHRQAARQALERMRKPGRLAGVRDLAGVYRPGTLALVNPQLRKLADQHGFVLVVETVPTLPQNRDLRTGYVQAWSQDRAQRTSASRALYVLVSQDPPAIRVALGASENKDDLCCSPEFAQTLGRRIQDRLKQKDPDQGLVEAVDLLAAALEGKARP